MEGGVLLVGHQLCGIPVSDSGWFPPQMFTAFAMYFSLTMLDIVSNSKKCLAILCGDTSTSSHAYVISDVLGPHFS